MNIYDEEWVCEVHPDKPFPHDGCPGPGMLSDESCAKLENWCCQGQRTCSMECEWGRNYLRTKK